MLRKLPFLQSTHHQPMQQKPQAQSPELEVTVLQPCKTVAMTMVLLGNHRKENGSLLCIMRLEPRRVSSHASGFANETRRYKVDSSAWRPAGQDFPKVLLSLTSTCAHRASYLLTKRSVSG